MVSQTVIRYLFALPKHSLAQINKSSNRIKRDLSKRMIPVKFHNPRFQFTIAAKNNTSK